MKRDYLKDLELRKKLLDWLSTNRVSEDAAELVNSVIESGGKIFAFGNGGSASQASHFVAELVNRFDYYRSTIAGIALTTDTSVLTSVANDSSYSRIFSRQIEALSCPKDLAIGISTSGSSENVLEGLKKASEMGLKTIGMCGSSTKDFNEIPVDMAISIPSEDTPAIQEMHLFILHRIAGYLEWKAGVRDNAGL